MRQESRQTRRFPFRMRQHPGGACRKRAGRLSWALALALAGAGPVPAQSSPADDAFRGALASVLQGRGAQAVATLRGLDSAALSSRNAATRGCMLERLGRRRLPSGVADPLVQDVLTAYRQYWLRALLDGRPAGRQETRLLERLNRIVARADAKPAATLDELEPALDSVVRARGYHVLLGVTSPLRELMLWRTETEQRYDVELPEHPQPVTVVLMDDFASLGWAGFATCDRSHSGGWTKPERLYAVRSAYDLDSETYRVSYLAHEAQHFADNHRFPALERQEELEYRAKLTELALARETVHDLLEAFARNTSDDTGVPHSYANGRVVRDLAGRLGTGGAAPVWRDVPVGRINEAAEALLREETARLAAAGGK